MESGVHSVWYVVLTVVLIVLYTVELYSRIIIVLCTVIHSTVGALPVAS